MVRVNASNALASISTIYEKQTRRASSNNSAVRW